LLFNNTFFACFNSRTVKRWFTKKGGRLKPDKTAREGDDPFKVSGREILANMDKNTKQALRKATRKSDAKLSHSIGYLSNIKNSLIIRGDSGFQEGIKENLIIEFVQNGVDNIMVADVLRMIDIDYDPLQIIEHAIVRYPIITDGQISSWKSVRINDFPPSSKFIAFINREVECPPAARSWFFRRDRKRMEELGYAAKVVNTPMLRGLMSAAYWSGLTRPQAEYLICKAVQETFLDSALTVIAASIDDLKFVPPANGNIGRRVPQSIPFKDGAVKIYFTDRLDSRSEYFTKPCPIVLSLGVGPAALQATLALQPIESREAKVALIQQRVRSNDKLALDVADAALPAMEVFIVEAQLEMVVTKQTSAERKRLTVAEKELVLAEALGGEKRSILSVTACPNLPVRIRVADRAGSSVWRDALLQCLTSDEGRSIPGGHFVSIRAKRGDVRVVRLLRNSSDGEAVELNPLRPQDIEDRICNFVFRQKPLFLYGTTLDGNSIVWDDSSDAPPTPLEDLGPMGPIISSEGLIFTDIRQIFEPHEG
jgi:hypothetical protein